MNIDPLNNSNYIPQHRRNGSTSGEPTGDTSSNNGADQLSAGLSASVRATLATLPEIRPEMVSYGRQLLADPSYPGPDIVQEIASLITPLSEEQ